MGDILGICDFLFCKILVHNLDIAKEILELILNRHIVRVAVQKQQSIEITADGRGIRLDVYAGLFWIEQCSLYIQKSLCTEPYVAAWRQNN